jgi:hypothetical protein
MKHLVLSIFTLYVYMRRPDYVKYDIGPNQIRCLISQENIIKPNLSEVRGDRFHK